ncbi:MAG: SpoIIIAH-like family protein [Bacillota bacterium]|jgi:stage III sporulation protein AH
MRVLTMRKGHILIIILIICCFWLVFSIFCSFYSSPGSKAHSAEKNQEVEPVSRLGERAFEIIPSGLDMEDFFVNYRIDREKIRSQQVEILKEIIDNPNTGNTARKNAQKNLLELTKAMENELKLENLIKAKQYQDAAVFISPETVMVVVKGQSINEIDSLGITELISNTTGHSDEEVMITTKN